MAKHIEAIHHQQPTNCLGVFDQFVKLALTGLKTNFALAVAFL